MRRDYSKSEPWFCAVNVGDKLRPDSAWNKSERPPNQLAEICEILALREAQSQSGILFAVRTRDGTTRYLDAAWFLEPLGGNQL